MKTKLILIVVGIITLTTMFFISCNKENTKETETLKVLDFQKKGEIHNSFLTNIKDNFDDSHNIKELNDRIDYINEFNKDFVYTLDIPNSEKEMIIQTLGEYKELVVTDVLIEKCFNYSKDNDDEPSLFEMIDEMSNYGTISDDSENILNSLSQKLKLNYEKQLSDTDLKNEVNLLVSEFNSLGYNYESGEGQMIGTILAISVASIEWWEDNPDAVGENRIAPWLAGDIAGAVIGAVGSGISSYAGTGKVNWKSVGVGAIYGAVIGSTGGVGRLGRWLIRGKPPVKRK